MPGALRSCHVVLGTVCSLAAGFAPAGWQRFCRSAASSLHRGAWKARGGGKSSGVRTEPGPSSTISELMVLDRIPNSLMSFPGMESGGGNTMEPSSLCWENEISTNGLKTVPYRVNAQ